MKNEIRKKHIYRKKLENPPKLKVITKRRN